MTTAITFHDYTGDGSDLTFDYTFPTYAQSEVKVDVEGVTVNNFTIPGYATSGTKTVTFDNTTGTLNTTVCEASGAPKSGLAVRVYRRTDLDTNKATFSAGSAIKASDLNDNNTQVLRAAQEMQTQTTMSVDIKDAAIIRSKIATDAVDGTKIADDVINSEHYVAGSIDLEHMSANSVDSDQYVDGSIDLVHMSANSVDSDQYVDGSIDLIHMSANSVDSDQYVDGSIDLAHMSANSVDSDQYVDGSIDRVHLEADIIDGTKLADNAVNSEHITAGSVDLAHMSANSVDSDQYVDGSVDRVHLEADIIDSTKLADNAVGTEHIADAELTTLAGMQSGTASILAGGTALTATLAEINTVVDGKSVETTISDTDAAYPTSGAVVDYVAAQIAPIGGLEVIATDAAFPNVQPAAGVVISIADAGGLVVNGSGTSTTGRTVGASTVTINNIASNFNNTTVDAGVAMMVSSTGSGQIYNYHKATLKEADLLSLSNDINDFANRYRVVSGEPGSNNDEGDLIYDTAADKMKVYDSTTSAFKEVTSTGDFKYLFLCPAGGTGAPTLNGSIATYDLRETTNSGAAASVTSAAQLLVSINGVVQKANTGTSAPAEGFALVDANTIIFGSNLASGDSIFIIQFGSALTITTPGDNTVATAKLQANSVSEEKLKVSNSPTNDLVLTADSGVSGGMKWAESGSVTTWTLGINGSANAYTFTGDGFASATDDPDLYLSRGQTYKFVNGNSSGTHAFNIEKSDHDQSWSAYTTGMTGAGATGGNTMTWTVPMDAPSLLKYVSGTTSGMTGFIYIVDSTNTDEGFTCWTGSRVSGLQINNGANGSHMAFFGTHPTGYQPYIQGRAGAVTTFASADSYSFGNGNLNLKSYGTNETTPATIKFEGGGSSNTYGVTISGPATAQATSNYTITLPGVVPTANGQALTATTAGVCSWSTVESTKAGGAIYENSNTISEDHTLTANTNGMSAGPITVNSGITLTIPSGATYTVI